MKNFLALAAIAFGMALNPTAFADEKMPERVAHYQGKEAESLEAAIANLRGANARLSELLAGPVGEYDMHDIHSLSYTLEEAVARMGGELKAIADDLEAMHFYSEGLKRDEVIRFGKAYLDGIGKIVQ